MKRMSCWWMILGCFSAAAGPPQHLRELLDEFPHYAPYDAVAGTVNSIDAKFGTNDDMETVSQFYRGQLAESGWSIEHQHASERSSYFGVQKGGIRGSVDISDQSGLPRSARMPRTSVNIRLVDTGVAHCRTDADPPEDPAARALLDSVIAHYATLESYRDRGEQSTKFSGGHTSTLQFMTAFQRPRQFRFEFESDGHNYVVHQDGDAVQTHWTVTRELEQDLEIDMALAGAHGVSGGTGSTVAELLGVLEDGSGLAQLRDLQLLEEQTVQGVLCLGIHGFDYKCNPTTLWIGKDDLLLRRIEGGAVLPGFSTEEVTNYEPEANIELTAEDLAFDQHGRLPKSGGRSEGVMGIVRWFFGG